MQKNLSGRKPQANITLDPLGIKKLTNHASMMRSISVTGKKEHLIRVEATGLKLVVYDPKYEEVCYLGILDPSFFKEMDVKQDVTLRIASIRTLHRSLKFLYKYVSFLDPPAPILRIVH